MPRFRILPYKQGSKSAKVLAEELGGRVLKLEGSKFKPKPSDTIINWGNTDPWRVHWPGAHPKNILNLPNQVRNASNKLFFFNCIKENNLEIIPRFWTKPEDIPSDAYPVVCRTVLAGHSGAGIVIAYDSDDLVSAPLYVQYVKKKDEFRVHVGRKGESLTTIAVQRKARILAVPDESVNWQIRNLAGGFTYARQGFTVPSPVEKVAHDCLRETGLDFGAVDVVWNANQEKAYVLEVNTAPGLEGQTVGDYATFFQSL